MHLTCNNKSRPMQLGYLVSAIYSQKMQWLALHCYLRACRLHGQVPSGGWLGHNSVHFLRAIQHEETSTPSHSADGFSIIVAIKSHSQTDEIIWIRFTAVIPIKKENNFKASWGPIPVYKHAPLPKARNQNPKTGNISFCLYLYVILIVHHFFKTFFAFILFW